MNENKKFLNKQVEAHDIAQCSDFSDMASEAFRTIKFLFPPFFNIKCFV